MKALMILSAMALAMSLSAAHAVNCQAQLDAGRGTVKQVVAQNFLNVMEGAPAHAPKKRVNKADGQAVKEQPRGH